MRQWLTPPFPASNPFSFLPLSVSIYVPIFLLIVPFLPPSRCLALAFSIHPPPSCVSAGCFLPPPLLLLLLLLTPFLFNGFLRSSPFSPFPPLLYESLFVFSCGHDPLRSMDEVFGPWRWNTRHPACRIPSQTTRDQLAFPVRFFLSRLRRSEISRLIGYLDGANSWLWLVAMVVPFQSGLRGSYVYDDGFGSVVGSMFKILYNWYASFRMKNRKINLLFIFLTRIENWEFVRSWENF